MTIFSARKLDNHDKLDLPKEFADVIITTLMLAKSVDVDMKKALKDKIEKIRGGKYKPGI